MIRRLYVGPLKAARDYEWQRRVGITHVITLTEMRPWRVKPEHIDRHLNIPISDSGGLRRHIPTILSFIRKGRRKGKVLVHCAQAKNRSVVAIMAYLMDKYKMNIESALLFMRSIRPCVSPRAELLNEVRNYFNDLEMRKYNVNRVALGLSKTYR